MKLVSNCGGIMAASVIGLLVMGSPAASAAACSSYIIPSSVTVRSETIVELRGTLQSSTCTCTNKESAILTGSSTLVGRWTGLLLTAEATRSVVRVYSAGSCQGNWYVASAVAGTSLSIE